MFGRLKNLLFFCNYLIFYVKIFAYLQIYYYLYTIIKTITLIKIVKKMKELILKIDGVEFTTCFTRKGELNNIKKNQAIDIIDYDVFYILVFEESNGRNIEVMFSHDGDGNVNWLNPIRAIEWDGDIQEECTIELVNVKYY